MPIMKTCGSLIIVKRLKFSMQIQWQKKANLLFPTMHAVWRFLRLQVRSGSVRRQAKFMFMPWRPLSRLVRLWLANTLSIALRVILPQTKWPREITKGMLKYGRRPKRRSNWRMAITRTLFTHFAGPVTLKLRVSLTIITSSSVT